MIKIITTVGTSIFTNYQKTEVRAKLGRNYVSIDTALQRTETLDNHEIPSLIFYDDKYDKYRVYVRELDENISDLWFSYPDFATLNVNASAEISSILKIVEQVDEPCEVHLVATDTLQSVLAAELIVKWFSEFRQEKVAKVLFQRPDTTFKSQKDSDYVVKDLRVGTHKDYEKGFFNFFDLLDKISKSKTDLILNITGGYKALIPLATLYAQIKNIPIKYLYEGNLKEEESLISLSHLPFHFDWELLELLSDYIEDEGLRKSLPDSSDILNILRKYKIIKDENKELTIIGVLVSKFINDRFLKGKTLFGFVAEYKVFEFLVERGESPKRSEEYWWEVENKEKYSLEPMYDKKEDKEKRVEIDIISRDNEQEKWYEVKSFSRTGLRAAYSQAIDRLEFLEKALKKLPNVYILVLYKFSFEEIKKNQQIVNIVKIFQQYHIPFEIWYFDVPVNLTDEKINNNSFLTKKIELKKLNY